MLFTNHGVTCHLKATPDNPRNSDSSMVRCADGSLLLAYQRFDGSELRSNDEAPCTISTLRSYDEGKSWVEPNVISNDKDCINVYAPNLFLKKDGKVGFIYHKNICFWEGKTTQTTLMIKESEDNGKTFGEPRIIFDSLNYASSGSGAIIRTSTGRLVLPLMKFSGGRCTVTEHIIAEVLYSDDDGNTWSFSRNGMDVPMRGALETYVAEAADGTLVAVIRTQLGSMFIARSSDMGETWSKPQTSGLIAPESSPYITRVPNSEAMIVVWNNAEFDMHFNHSGKRNPLTIAITYDNGKTFSDFFNVEDDPRGVFSNTTAFWLNDSEFFLTYWTCIYTDNWLMTEDTDLKQVKISIDRTKLLK